MGKKSKKKKAKLKLVWLGDRGSVWWGHSVCHSGGWGGFAVSIMSSGQNLGGLVGTC